MTFQEHELDTSAQAFALMRSSIDLINDAAALRHRLEVEGYLYLPGYLDRDEVMAARSAMCEKLAALDMLVPDQPIIEAVYRAGTPAAFMPQLAHDNPPLMKLLYSGRMIRFYERLLGGPVRHFDYTWCRSVPPGKGTYPHCDVVYMGRGTPRLYTSWTPIGDVSLKDGGLILMEKSNQLDKLRDNYGSRDVDTFCANRLDESGRAKPQDPMYGVLTKDPVRLRASLGLRWLTREFHAGDLVVFSVYSIHGGLDNHGKRIRLSTDSRYQLAGEPADDRWISIDGRPPRSHGEASRRELIC
jgi:hypothetical protein